MAGALNKRTFVRESLETRGHRQMSGIIISSNIITNTIIIQ